MKITVGIYVIAVLSIVEIALASTEGEPRNAFSAQPSGIFFLRTNIEYERLVSSEGSPLSLAARFNMTSDGFKSQTIFGSHFSDSYNGPSSSWSGFGISGRLYLAEERMHSYYFGVNLDYYSGTTELSPYLISEQQESIPGHFLTLGFETGRKITLGTRGYGLFLMPSAGFMLYLSKEVPDDFKAYFYFIGLGIGYQF